MMLTIGVGLVVVAWTTRPPDVRRFAQPRSHSRRMGSIDGLPVLVGAVSLAGLVAGSPLLIVGPAAVGIVVRSMRRSQRIERADAARAADLRSMVDAMVAHLRQGGTLTGAFLQGSASSDGRWSSANSLVAAGQSAARAIAANHGDPDELLLTATIDALERTGSPAIDALERLGDALRERAAHREDLATQTRHTTASAAVLAVMPIGFASLGAIMSGDLASFYLQTWAGAAAMITGVGLGAAGWSWLRRMTNGAR